MSIKILSYNVRCCDDANGNTIEERAPRLKYVLDDYDADLIGFQEVTPKWNDKIKNMFSGKYGYYLCWREFGFMEATPIAWKKDKFTLLKKGSFWFSDTPSKRSPNGHCYDTMGCSRICSYVTLKCDEGTFTYFNTHYGFGNDEQLKTNKLLFRKIETVGHNKAVLTADFNMTPDAPAYKELCQHYTDVNAATVNDPSPTFHSYGTIAGQKIDYCFITDFFEPVNQKIITDKPGNMFVSDHFGLLSEISIPRHNS